MTDSKVVRTLTYIGCTRRWVELEELFGHNSSQKRLREEMSCFQTLILLLRWMDYIVSEDGLIAMPKSSG